MENNKWQPAHEGLVRVNHIDVSINNVAANSCRKLSQHIIFLSPYLEYGATGRQNWRRHSDLCLIETLLRGLDCCEIMNQLRSLEFVILASEKCNYTVPCSVLNYWTLVCVQCNLSLQTRYIQCSFQTLRCVVSPPN